MKSSVRVCVHILIVSLVVMGIVADASVGVRAAQPQAAPVSSSFVTRNGAQLLLDGQPFTFTGVNIYSANSDGSCGAGFSDAQLLEAFNALASGRRNVVVRAWFFQTLATTKWTGERDWTRFDRMLALARQTGVHVIATLTDQWGECGDGGISGYKTADWYRGGYATRDEALDTAYGGGGRWKPYREYAAEVAARYKDDPTIMAWQLINEAEVKASKGAGCVEAAAPAPSPTAGPFPSPSPTPPPIVTTSFSILRDWAREVVGWVRFGDTNHLISLGTMGGGQCGAQYTEYEALHAIPEIDFCEYHDYSLATMPGDQWNGLQFRLDQCANLGKPLFVGETGIKPNDVGGTLAARSALFDAKFSTQFAAGVVGEVMWNYGWIPSALDNYDIGPGDPALDRFHSVPLAPDSVVAAAGDTVAAVTWRAPSSDGGAALIDYTVYAQPTGSAVATVAASATSAAVSGLSNGTSYTFTVSARNAVGSSVPSAASVSVTPQAGAAPPAAVMSQVPPSGTTVTTSATAPTATDPLTTSVTVPATAGGGSISVVETAPTGAPPAGGFQFMGQQIDIVSTAATSPSNPLTIVFTVDDSALVATFGVGYPSLSPDAVDISRAEGGPPVVLSTCASPTTAPNPCVLDRQWLGTTGDLQITILTPSASLWNAVVNPVRVTVSDAGYAPRSVTVKQGAPVVWTFNGARAHTVTDASRLGTAAKPALFNSGPMTTGRYGYVFRAAGTYPYGSIAKNDPAGMTGAVQVPLVTSPTTGTTTTAFTVTWSSATSAGYVFDVSYRFQKPGATAWSDWKWKAGETVTRATFTPARGPGTYAFVARVRNTAIGNASGWSPEARIVVRAP
ncbi:MAG: fibronectin type III domain-containing protein [Chloroflexota bacterium]|nr:fibronectin type III domain-containing protein [Chloroflexota bacterium]